MAGDSSKSASLEDLNRQLARGHRGLIALIGSYGWAVQTVRQIWSTCHFAKTASLTEYSTDLGLSVKPSSAYQYLGQEFDALFADMSGPLKPDALAILIGCVRGGGVICVYLGPSIDTFPVESHLCVEGWDDDAVGHRLRSRFLSSLIEGKYCLFEGDETVDIGMIRSPLQAMPIESEWTSDQKAAHAAILKVATGRRRRPLILEAPRGRGKSTILGQAVVDILGHRAAHIQVVMPHAHSALPLLNLVEKFLGRSVVLGQRMKVAEDRSLTILTMEQLWSNEESADVVFVDEAATFPVHLLSIVLAKTSRIVFSTTTSGYEGTGQGFRLRFDPLLPNGIRIENLLNFTPQFGGELMILWKLGLQKYFALRRGVSVALRTITQ